MHIQHEFSPTTYFPFPNQLPTQATTAGQPVVCTSPFMTCRMKQKENLDCVNVLRETL